MAADPGTGTGVGLASHQVALTIVVHADGTASVGGVPVKVDGTTDIAVVRAAAMAAAISLVARMGRSIRAVAREPDGGTWPLVIHPNGLVEDGSRVGLDDKPASPRGAVPVADGPAVRRGAAAAASGTLVLARVGLPEIEPPPPPERLRSRLERIGEAGSSGNFEAAVTMAADLERDVRTEFGKVHPYVLQARAVRAHVSFLAHDWVRAADSYLGIAQAWLSGEGATCSQAMLNAANAHACWLRVSDATEGERIGEAVIRLWQKMPGAERQLRAACARKGGSGRQSAFPS
ncbi:hypothetical protein [Streptomyces sp. Isolate_45]|uniref:hypothetical protein n=1 Tax=Streptomyces sp. Isolate_45 TaxID=2950111 RepID=UPI002481E8BF|nr:hypothetical protein [Streptomyces sp. Isolate_45]MDA5282536.1 hypothetical protein [Streptomyces sp. Isolate_45]